jgi:hypothetical protein
MIEQLGESFVTIPSQTMQRFDVSLGHIGKNCVLTPKQKSSLLQLLNQAKQESNWEAIPLSSIKNYREAVGTGVEAVEKP